LLACGWHYGRVWARFGKPIVGNWDALPGQEGQGQWWLEPGFGTSAFYAGFGRSLISPSFSGFHSFADGLYSTLWGDGLASGAADLRGLRPPWNYDLAGAGYWASLGISLLLIIGAALVLARIMREPRGEWLLVFGMVGSFSLGLLWINLTLPYFAQSKAFYAFPALLPFSALVAVGWDWLRQRRRAVGIAVWVLLLVWSMTVYTSFWIRSANPATQLIRITEWGSALLRQGKLDEAIGEYQEAIRLNPDYANAHNNLGIALARKGQTDEAIGQYREALRLNPDHADAHNGLGIALDKRGQIDEAIRQLQQAIRLNPDHVDAHYNLGVAFYQQGRTAEAIRQFQEVIRLKPNHAEAHNNLGTALGLGGHTDEAIRQFQEALRLKPDYADARRNLDAVLATKAHSPEPPGPATNR
jgi:tetratricopeptide (TPR) repeat protein